MHFKRLEMVGFKSFCDKTALNFEPGITAVVGPNGCGKSNIFDSIRWVLGEQSAKSLRGSDMQDVIFNGTDNREPVSMAEVTLTFDNRNRFFNFDNDEVAITRRLFRSGESEYLLNKSGVRLKDILDLLLGTGVGAESYSIVAQGKIDLVLSSKPEDRRQVFDEASGITKYKAQKRETMRKLEDTEQNLLRVNDIITEVKRQIGSLERQANKARRYKEVFDELKGKEVNFAVLQKEELLRQKDEVIAGLKDLESRQAELLVVIQEQETKIANRQKELKGFEDSIMSLKNEILSSENSIVRNNERVDFNNERIIELAANKKFLEQQAEETRNQLIQDESKLEGVRAEYNNLKSQIDEKTRSLDEQKIRIGDLDARIKASLDGIADTKKKILELVSQIASHKNQISGFSAQQQSFNARRKRLEVEKVKVYEERAIAEDNLNVVLKEAEALKYAVDEINLKISVLKVDQDTENVSLSELNSRIGALEKESLALESHKEFLEKLKTKYEDISESLNATIYLDRMPAEIPSGLVIKIKDQSSLNDEDQAYLSPANFKLSGEAKPIELDTVKIGEKIANIAQEISGLIEERTRKEARLNEIASSSTKLHAELRSQEIALANKETLRQNAQEQCNKIREEEDLIVMELSDVQREISVLEANLISAQAALEATNKEHLLAEDRIMQEEESIRLNAKSREELLVNITQIKTEIEALNKRIVSDEATLRLLEEAFRRDTEALKNIERQVAEGEQKREELHAEIQECRQKNVALEAYVVEKNALLKESEAKYEEVSAGTSDVLQKIDSDKKELDSIKDRLYELQLADKDIEHSYSSIKERLLQAYRVDLEAITEVFAVQEIDTLKKEIDELKRKVDSYGSVNMVAIEEYDELKQRYDFLTQQHADLLSAKESLHDAILKINRTTKQMFVETFEKVREEFKTYFRLLFNGGDAQLYLVDEQDPLESGIEIICRPPGKKLQNVLLLSGGEKSMAAIALIFAIFKVKPSPFCILDEIDAALDEANVDRFGRMLLEFAKTSQFIVVTHNKRTIANADVMYGITMEQSGISKIVSVKFGEKKAPEKDKEPDMAVA